MSIFPVQTPRDLSTMYCRGLLLLTASRCHPEGFNKRTLQGTAHINVGNTAGPHSMVYRWRPGLWAGSTDSAQPAMSWPLGKVQRMPPQYQAKFSLSCSLYIIESVSIKLFSICISCTLNLHSPEFLRFWGSTAGKWCKCIPCQHRKTRWEAGCLKAEAGGFELSVQY